MELDFTPEQEELRSSVKTFLANECPITLVREVVEKGTGADRLWPEAVGLDWPSLTVPEEYGGMGFGMIELAVLMEETGAVIAPLPLLGVLGLYVPLVLEVASPAERDALLRPIVTGSIGTVAIAEASGSLEPSTCTARRDGDEVVLDGTKSFVFDADRASVVLVPARLDDGVVVAAVPGDALTPSATPTVDATRPLWSVDLTGVRAPVVGGFSDKRDALRRVVDYATVALSLELFGTCSAMFAIALEYAKVREQFGVKIGSFQAMKHKLADMFVALEAAQATVYYGAAVIAAGSPDAPLAASMAKSLVGDCQRRMVQEGIQTLGGIGYTWEHDMHLYVKRSIASAALLGTTEQHRARVADLITARL